VDGRGFYAAIAMAYQAPHGEIIAIFPTSNLGNQSQIVSRRRHEGVTQIKSVIDQGTTYTPLIAGSAHELTSLFPHQYEVSPGFTVQAQTNFMRPTLSL